MIRYNLSMIILLLLIPSGMEGQERLNYQAAMISNPSVTGLSGNGTMRLSYMNQYPGNNFNLHSVYLSYDSYFPALHGGAGFYISDEYLGGIVNNLSSGLSYSYILKMTEKLYVSAGLSASFYHRGYDFSNAVLPDQIDPLYGVFNPSGETFLVDGKTVFDLASGFTFMAGKFFGGLSVNHLTEPDPSTSDYEGGNLNRMLLIHGAGDFNISSERNLRILPLISIMASNDIFSAGGGASLESKSLSVNAIMLADNRRNLDLQTGFSISLGNLMLFYSYRFNLVSGENLLPFSLQHHTGIALGLNNVDKRKIIKTINFPKL